MAQNESNIVEQSNDDELVTITVSKSMLRYLPVEPSAFKAEVTARELTSKQVAAAIGRTLSRVSELTHSKGASRLIFEEFVTKLDAFVAAQPKVEAEAAEAAE